MELFILIKVPEEDFGLTYTYQLCSDLYLVHYRAVCWSQVTNLGDTPRYGRWGRGRTEDVGRGTMCQCGQHCLDAPRIKTFYNRAWTQITCSAVQVSVSHSKVSCASWERE